MRDKRPETRVLGRTFFDCRISVERKENRTIVFEAPEAQFNRYCDCLLGVLVDSGYCLIDWNCQESRVEVLGQVTRSHRIGPVGGGFTPLANQTRVICRSAYGAFSAGFILDEGRSFISFFL